MIKERSKRVREIAFDSSEPILCQHHSYVLLPSLARLRATRTTKKHHRGVSKYTDKKPVEFNRLEAFRNVCNNPQKVYDIDINPESFFYEEGL